MRVTRIRALMMEYAYLQFKWIATWALETPVPQTLQNPPCRCSLLEEPARSSQSPKFSSRPLAQRDNDPSTFWNACLLLFMGPGFYARKITDGYIDEPRLAEFDVAAALSQRL
ncbi:hypothetical protein PTT_17529 [Pyrenophora teres f. teres 0-1]|uniref:Uncharacterized protein n=1 Tax=Pyrenophora teres f. teres (strain 0-1) TaxID=861557 RepID=E3S4M0_PYRTT|nr:hypothetical protein PTT_17529 [Pyrenophora teres f. teres 0-1]